MIERPSWIANLPLAVAPPFYGLGAINTRGKTVIGYDSETYRMPEVNMVTGSGRQKRYVRRKVPRLVVGSWYGRGARPKALRGPDMFERTDGVAWGVLTNRADTVTAMHAVLDDPNIILVGHQVVFDLAVAANTDPTLLPKVVRALANDRIICTKIREMLINIAFGTMREDEDGRPPDFKLSTLEKNYLDEDRSDQKKGEDIWRLRYHELDGVPLAEWPTAARDYTLDDSRGAFMVALMQAPIGRERIGLDFMPVSTPDGGLINEAPQVRADWALHLMGSWGMRTDPVLYEAWGKEIEAAVSKAEHVARMAGFLRPNGSVDKKKLQSLIEQDCKARGVEPLRTEATKSFPEGQVKIGAKDVLVYCTAIRLKIENEDGELVDVAPLEVWGSADFLRKMRSTYYDPAGMGRLSAMLYDFNVLVSTGRTSAFGPNMQNPPRDGAFRELFIPRAGMVFCSTDYTALELTTLAQLHYWWFGHSKLRDAFVAGEDPHALFGAKLAGVPFEEFKARLADPKDATGAKKIYRQLAKVFNFGAPGGLGAAKFVKYALDTYGLKLGELAVTVGFATADEPEEERAERFTRHLLAEFKAFWTEIPRYMGIIGGACEQTGTFTYLQMVSWRQRGSCGYCDGNNTGFQGLAADGAKEAAWRLSVMCYLPPEEAAGILAGAVWSEGADVLGLCRDLYGIRPVLFLHDELFSEGPAHTAHVWAEAQSRVLVEAMGMYTPDIPQNAPAALMERWYKGADPVYEDGKLVPWQPKKKEAA